MASVSVCVPRARSNAHAVAASVGVPSIHTVSPAASGVVSRTLPGVVTSSCVRTTATFGAPAFHLNCGAASSGRSPDTRL